MSIEIDMRADSPTAHTFAPCRPSKRSAHGSTRHATVLVVDDDSTTRRLLAGMLAFDGYRTLQASTGEETLQLVRDCAPDIVLLDLALPTLSGLDVLRTLRQNCAHQPRVVVVGAYTDYMPDADRSLADASLSKPFDVDELLDVVSRLASLVAPA